MTTRTPFIQLSLTFGGGTEDERAEMARKVEAYAKRMVKFTAITVGSMTETDEHVA